MNLGEQLDNKMVLKNVSRETFNIKNHRNGVRFQAKIIALMSEKFVKKQLPEEDHFIRQKNINIHM